MRLGPPDTGHECNSVYEKFSISLYNANRKPYPSFPVDSVSLTWNDRFGDISQSFTFITGDEAKRFTLTKNKH